MDSWAPTGRGFRLLVFVVSSRFGAGRLEADGYSRTRIARQRSQRQIAVAIQAGEVARTVGNDPIGPGATDPE